MTLFRTVTQCDHNLIWSTARGLLLVRGIHGGRFEDWKKLGFDEHSVVADPLFVDPAAGDYRLRPNSPAFAMGFKPIDFDQIGLREPYRSRFREDRE